MSASRRAPRLLLLVLLGLLLGVLGDFAASLAIDRFEAFAWRPLPPYGAVTNPRQRQWLERQRAELTGSAEPTTLGRFDPELGWSYRPSSVSPRGERTNSRGWRGGREYPAEPAPGVLRIAAFGDSFTFGAEVADDETWEARLEASRPDLEVLNLGVGGYGTDQALLRLRREGAELSAHVALIGLLLENVGRNVNRLRTFWHPSESRVAAKPRFVLEEGALRLVEQPFATRAGLIAAAEDGSLVERLWAHEHWRGPWVPAGLRWSALARFWGRARAARERDVRRLWRDPEGEPFRVTVALLEAFCREARELGIPEAAVLVFPGRPDTLSFLETGERYWAALPAELERRGLRYLDLSTALADEARRAGEPASLFAEAGHYSARGNAVVARAVGEWLESWAPRPARARTAER